MKETNHDYQGCIVGNFYSSDCSATFDSWDNFKLTHSHFQDNTSNNCDDTYNFVFRYDIHKKSVDVYQLELCMMLQRKGIYTHIIINNISQKLLDTEIKKWLEGRKEYILKLWELMQ